MKQVSEELSAHFRTMSFVCACLIVALHACARPESGTWSWFIAFFIGSGVCNIAVPFFFLTSGFFFAGHLGEAGWYGRSLSSRVRSLLVPFISWRLIGVVFGFCVAYGIRVVGYSNYHGNIVIPDFSLSWWLNLPGLNPFANIGVIWYLRSLFLLILISPLLVCLLRKMGMIAIAIPFLVYCILAYALETNTKIWNFFEYFFSLRGLVYFLVGIHVRECLICIPDRAGGVLALSGVVLVVIKACLVHRGDRQTAAVVDCLMVPGLMLGVWHLTRYFKLPTPVTAMAFPLYLAHQLVLLVIVIGLAAIGLSGYAKTSLLAMSVKIVLAIAISWGITLVIRRFEKISCILYGGR